MAKGKNRKDERGLTPLMRRFVSACLQHPDLDWADKARKAGVRIHPSEFAARMRGITAVRLALAAGTPDKKTGRLPSIDKAWLQSEMQKIYLDPRTPVGEKIKLLRSLGDTVEGFNVPVGVKHSGKLGIEDWVAEGLPPEKEEETNVRH